MLLSNHLHFRNCVPLDIWVDIIMCLASQCAIAAADTLILIDHHHPSMFTFGHVTGCFGRGDRTRSSSDCNANGGQLQEFTSIDVCLSHLAPRDSALPRVDTSALAREPAPYRLQDQSNPLLPRIRLGLPKLGPECATQVE